MRPHPGIATEGPYNFNLICNLVLKSILYAAHYTDLSLSA